MGEDSNADFSLLNPLKTNLREVASMPGKVVRVESLRAGSDAELEEVLEMTKQGHTVYGDLRGNYGIKIPEFTFEIVERKVGRATLHTYVDKIDGVNVAEGSSLPTGARDKFDAFYRGLADYYYDTFLNGGNYWGDFRNDQLVYGHKQGETENEVYVVDLDTSNIGIGNYDVENKRVSNKRLFEQLFSVAYAITQVEAKLADSPSLEAARQGVLSKLSIISVAEPDYKILEEAKQLLLRAK